MNSETFAIGLLEYADLGLLTLVVLLVGARALVSSHSAWTAERRIVCQSRPRLRKGFLHPLMGRE